MANYDKNNIQVFESSAKSAKPLCAYYGSCGGCDLQHVSYDEQLLVKMRWLKQIFANFKDLIIRHIIPSPKEYYYRNRITLHHDKKTYGFYRTSSHDIVAIQKCVIASETINNSRLVGRSVWNSRWLLIIPGGTLNADRDEGLQRLINGELRDGERTGNGITDILIFFQTYAFAGQ